MDIRIDTNTLTPDTNGEVTWTFTTAFEDSPIVTATALGENADANVSITAVSRTAVTLQTGPLPGGDTISAMAIGSTAGRRPPMILP